MKVLGKHCRHRKKHHKDCNTRQGVDLCHYKRPNAQKTGPSVDKKNRLALIVPGGHKTVMDVPAICSGKTYVGAGASHNGGKGIDNWNTGNNKRHDNSGKACDSCDGEK